uniref:DUF4806 domain-containing protein n=1 Tax=Trichogramma kaykai TaxID=54128 RepID=A0ABD2XEQ3_9HYME
MRSFISRKNRRDLNPDYLKRLNSGLLAARKKELISRQLEIQNLNVVNTPDLPQQNSNDFYVRNENDFCDHNDERYNPYYVDEINVSDQCSGSSDDDSEYSEYSDSSDDETDTLIDFEKRLGDAFLSTNMTHVQMKKILDVLHTHPCFSNLPKDPRTILKTPRDSAPIQLIAGGEYLHLGFEVAVELILNSTPSNFIPPTLLIDFFTDEACLDKRSNIRIWPIEIRIPNISHCEPEIVGVWKGDKKPTSAVELMKPFVDDVLVVLEAGGTVLYNNIKIPFQIRCFIADSPARAFIINHMGHNSRFPCCKCWIEGDYLHNSRVMVFPGIDHPLRSSESYKNKVDGEHHKEGEGVMEKILAGLVNGKYAESVKLSKINKLILDARLSEITKFCPRDFARKPTKIDKHSNFKATEFRQILLYSGAAIFSGIVREDVLVHYFLFQSAMRIYLSTDPSQELLNSAEFFIKLFIQSSEKVYGLEFLTETMPPKRPAGTGASNLFGNIMFMENAMHEHAKKRKTVNLTKSSNVSTKSSSSALSKSLSVSSKPSSISSKPSSASSKPSSGVSKSSSILSKLPSKGVLPSKKNLSHALINGQVPSEDSTVPGQPSYGYDSHTTSSLNHSLPPSSTLQPLNQNLSFSNRFDLLAQSPSSLGNKDVQSTNNLSVLPSASGQVMNKVIPSSRIVNPPKTNMLNLNKLSEKVDEIYERQDILLKAIMDIREGQRKEMEILEKIAKKKRGKVGEMPTFLPFESVASLMEFDTVASETDYDALVGYFEYISGVNIHDHCTRMISDGLALSETLLKSITWKGATKKYKLETSRFAEACKDAATRNDNFKDPTDLEFGEAMKACLKNYKEKLRRHLQDEESASIRKIRPREAIPREHQEDRVDPDDDQVLGQASEEEIDEESEQSYPEIPEDVFTRYEEQEDDEEDTEEI